MRQRVGTAANLFEDHPEEKLLGDLLLVPEAVASFLGGERHPWPRCEVKKRRLPRTRVLVRGLPVCQLELEGVPFIFFSVAPETSPVRARAPREGSTKNQVIKSKSKRLGLTLR